MDISPKTGLPEKYYVIAVHETTRHPHPDIITPPLTSNTLLIGYIGIGHTFNILIYAKKAKSCYLSFKEMQKYV